MSNLDFPDMGEVKADPAWSVAIVRSLWHGELTRSLSQTAKEALLSFGIDEKNIRIIDAPGSYELPLLCQTALRHGADAAIAFGVVVEGETHHARLIADSAAAGCMQAQLALRKPIIFEVLHVDDIAHARARSIGPEGKGPMAAATLVSMLASMREINERKT